jgi:hypothetical protein
MPSGFYFSGCEGDIASIRNDILNQSEIFPLPRPKVVSRSPVYTSLTWRSPGPIDRTIGHARPPTLAIG